MRACTAQHISRVANRCLQPRQPTWRNAARRAHLLVLLLACPSHACCTPPDIQMFELAEKQVREKVSSATGGKIGGATPAAATPAA